jgi:hypothetical protein
MLSLFGAKERAYPLPSNFESGDAATLSTQL